MSPIISGALLRETPPSDEERVRILQDRLGLLKPLLRSTTLRQLRFFECLHHDGLGGPKHSVALQYYERRDDEPRLTPEEVEFEVISPDFGDGLAVEGSFKWHWSYASHHGGVYGGEFTDFREALDIPDGHTHVWGVTSYGYWVLVRIDFVGRRDGLYRWESPTRVTIKQSDPEEIAQILRPPNPQYRFTPITDFLGELAREIERRRKTRHQEAERVLRQIEMEEAAIRAISERHYEATHSSS